MRASHSNSGICRLQKLPKKNSVRPNEPATAADRHYNLWYTIRRPFLFPVGYPGHQCEWERFTLNQAGCLKCGKLHQCPCNECVTEKENDGCTCCMVTGCVIRLNEVKNEWDAWSRTNVEKNAKIDKEDSVFNPNTLWESINVIVKELLTSHSAEECRRIERDKIKTQKISILQKILKNAKTKSCIEPPNMLEVARQLAWATRKHRLEIKLSEKEYSYIMDLCTSSITSVIMAFKNQNMLKVVTNVSKFKEFVCSMLFLMRVGVQAKVPLLHTNTPNNDQGRTILEKCEMLNYILPQESFLPIHFNIRCKSITEGENFLKIQMRQAQ